MPINTDLSVSPYQDDFNEEKNFYKVLFKPGVAVQVREINQLQTILQAQIEKFGNNIYKRGTIIDGVNFIYHPEYAYVKINDSQLDGIPAIPDAYVTNFAVDPTTNLTAHIINSVDGFESTNPDLKTLYVRYINSGNSGEETAFEPGSTLTVYDYLDSINKVTIDNGSSGFSNNDSVVFCSALAVNVATNTAFTVGETITQSGNTHFAVITAIETAKGNQVLRIRPRQADLTNTAISATIWEFTPGEDIVGSTSGATATIIESIGNSAAATLTTSPDIGKIIDIDMTQRGEGYYVPPFCTIKSSGIASAVGARNYNNLSLIARNYVAQIVVSNLPNAIGTGYAFSVTEGVIYQKGYFVRVNPQTVIVSKYDPAPDQLAIGFDTAESIVDSNVDQSLLDNATGTPNQFAPGADRLHLEPQLVVVDTAEAAANDEFLSIVEFAEGLPYRENKRTQFNTIMDEMALRTSEQSGDFVLDEFLVTTRSTANQSNEGKSFAVVTDPGRGYINGYRVETKTNYAIAVDKGIDSRSIVDQTATIDYGNYLLVNEVAGAWNCSTGTQVTLKNTAVGYASNTTLIAAGSLSGLGGGSIGTARVRNLVYESGEVGTGNATYRLYLFDVRMSAGYSFSAAKAVVIGTTAVADVVRTFDATTNTTIAKLQDTASGSSLIVDTGTDATKNLGTLTYTYRMTVDNASMANTGTLSVLLSATDEYFGYDSASLTDTEKKTMIITPTGDDIVFLANTSSDGTAAVTTSSNTITITSASVNKYAIGDFVALWSGASTYVIRRVTGKTSTTLQLDSNASFTNGTASFSKAFPKYVPISLHRITGATVTVTGGGKTLTVNLGTTINKAAAITCSATYDVEVREGTPQPKVASRDTFVKLDLTASNLKGPWCLGIPDIFRLKKVYLGNSSSVSTSSTDVTDQFFIDHNQTADYYGLGYLYKKSDANITLTASTWLLVQFDSFTSSAGVYTINSYVSPDATQRFADDSLTLSALGTKTNSFEIPEFFTSTGKYFDLINCIDFRPVATNTATYAKTAAAASVNPSATLSFSTANKKFPLPESGVEFDREYFMGRKDVVVIATDNRIKIVRGVPNDAAPYDEPKIPANTLVLNKLTIPAYPCVPEKFSASTLAILDKKMSSERLLLKRIRDKMIKSETTENEIKINQPKVFTMADVNQLERRVQDLEYTVALSLVESDLKDKVIPSSVSPNLNRFKFGFFVDDYTTTKNSDVDHIEYQADVVDSKVIPVSESILVTHGKGYRLGDWTKEFKLINQNIASEVPVVVVQPPPPLQPPVTPTPPVTTPTPPVVSPPTRTPTPPVVTNPTPPVVSPPTTTPPPAAPPPTPVVTAKTVSLYRSHRTSTYSYADNTGWLEFSSVPSTFNLKYNFYSDKDRLRIVKAGPPTANSTEGTVLYDNKIKGTGTLNFTHDPSTGRLYHFSVIKDSDHWEYTLNYPIDNVQYVTPAPPTTTINTTFYTGALVSISPGFMRAQELGQNFGALAYVSQGENQNVRIASLKPSTLHKVTITDVSSGVAIDPQVSENGVNNTSDSMMTDAYGVLNFNLLIDNTIMASLNDLGTRGTTGSSLPTSLLVNVKSTDNTSTAAFYLANKPVPVVTNNTTPPVTYGPPVAVVGRPGKFQDLDRFMESL